MEGHNWACNNPIVPGHELRGAVVGWYLPVLVVDEEQMKSGGVRVVVMMKKVAVGRTAGGVEQAVGIGCRQGWPRHRMSRGAVGGHHRTKGAGRW